LAIIRLKLKAEEKIMRNIFNSYTAMLFFTSSKCTGRLFLSDVFFNIFLKMFKKSEKIYWLFLILLNPSKDQNNKFVD